MIETAHSSPEVSGAAPLISFDETDDHTRVETAIGVGYQFIGESKNSRQGFPGTRRKLGELSIITSWQILAYLAQLILHEIVVVDEPFRFRGN